MQRLCVALVLLTAVLAPLAAQPLVFEAEKVSGPADAWAADTLSASKWNLWSTDSDAMRKWSGGIVLQSPPVMTDRDKPEDGAPVLHTVLTGIPKGNYVIEIKGGRDLGVSLDGKQWKRLSANNGQLGRFAINGGTFEFWVDDRYAFAAGPGSSYYDTITLTPMPMPLPKFKVSGWAKTRVAEKLDRGLVVMPVEGGKVYVGWRLLATDPANLAFNVYRATGRMLPVKLTPKPLTQTTDFVDEKPPLDKDNMWFVKPVLAGKELAASDTARLPANPEVKPYKSIKLGAPGDPEGGYTFQKVGLGDLNGDGKMDYVIKQPQDNIDPAGAYWEKSPDTYKLEAYLNDGTFLWRYDMGWGIERGIWYSPYVVRDFDGDGKAEVAAKTSEGDPRSEDGRVRSGPEYISILDGMTGKVRTRLPWPGRADFGTGEAGYNYAARNQLGAAYLDGKTPCLLVCRGTYTVMKCIAYQFTQNKLRELWTWDNREELDGNWRGQGAHWMHCGDLDGDGREEIVLGSCVIDDDGKGMWTTGLGHPDRCFLTDVDPARPGLEIFYHIEPAQKQNGLCLVDARTGKFVWGLQEQTYHVGSGMAADIDPLHAGMECWAAEDGKGDPKGENYKGNPPRWLLTAQGEILARDEKVPGVETLYWDADGLKELVSGGRIYKYLGGGTVAQGIEGGHVLQADIIGDWREELITSVKGELRVYTTTLPATDRHVCLLQDSIYRNDVTHTAMGYSQNPVLGYALKQFSPSLWMSAAASTIVVGQPVKVTATLAAPAEQAIAGKLTLTPDALLAVSPTVLDLSAAAGKTAEASFEVTLKEAPPLLYGGKAINVNAEFVGTGTSLPLRTVLALKVEEKPLEGVPLAQAEDFTDQTGGQVQVRTDKFGAVGKAISHWDTAGHTLQWKLNAPKAGKYWLILRCCSPAGAQRETTVDGGSAYKQGFGGTGGFGSTTSSDWAHQAVRGTDGNRVVFDLTAGEHVIKIVNLDGKGLNLDYLALVPL